MASINLNLELKNFVDKHIKDICDCGFSDNSSNHCAHFVSHVMGYTFGFRCKNITGKGPGYGVNIRVHEVFSKCGKVGEWNDKYKPTGNCLAFVTGASNVNLANKTMVNIPAKHIGIFCNNMIYHYSNKQQKVVCVTPENFSKHYSGSDIKVFYGTFPTI